MLKKVIVTAITILTLVYSAKIIVGNYSEAISAYYSNETNTLHAATADITYQSFTEFTPSASSGQALERSEGFEGKFEDVASTAGVKDSKRGRGVAFGDYDNDGDIDIYVANEEADTLYRNNGNGTFTDVTKSEGQRAIPNSDGDDSVSFEPCFFDYDNDGDLDIYIAKGGFTVGVENALYRNNSDGTFTDVAKIAGVADSRASFSVAVADYDNDGYLDIYVGNGEASEPPTNTLYHNNKDGTFSDVTKKAGLEDSSNTHDVTFFDYNNDGFIDLYVANGGFIPQQAVNQLYRNNGDGTFTDVTADSGVGNEGWAMSAIIGDYNNDGYMDIYVANWNSSKLGMPNALYRNNGDGTFTDVAKEAGLDYVGGSIGGAFGDYDNSGDLDLYVTTGGPMAVQSNLFYRNNGDGTFLEVSKEVGLRHLGNGHGVIFGDYDNDGDLDIYLTNGGRDLGQPNALYRNCGNRNNWLKVKLMGRQSNRWGIGAKVKAFINQSLQMTEVGSGSGFGGQNSLIAQFGLGAIPKVNRLEVNWTSGVKQMLENIPANQIVVIQEPLPKS